MAIVSDSSPLILYARIGRLELLHELFGEVLIPPAVRHEVVVRGRGFSDAALVDAAVWIQVRALSNDATADTLRSQVDPGEAEAIALGLEQDEPSAVILDDSKGRRLGHRYGLNVVGSGGILVLAKRTGLIPLVRPVLDELCSAGLYLSGAIYHEILAEAGEVSVAPDDPPADQ